MEYLLLVAFVILVIILWWRFPPGLSDRVRRLESQVSSIEHHLRQGPDPHEAYCPMCGGGGTLSIWQGNKWDHSVPCPRCRPSIGGSHR